MFCSECARPSGKRPAKKVAMVPAVTFVHGLGPWSRVPQGHCDCRVIRNVKIGHALKCPNCGKSCARKTWDV